MGETGLQAAPRAFPAPTGLPRAWALRGMTKSAAIDLGGRKIRVNSVHPGPIDTDMIAFRTPEQREERIKQVPMHRYGTPEEVAQLVAFLLSDEAATSPGRRSPSTALQRPSPSSGRGWRQTAAPPVPPRPYTLGTRNCLFTQFSSRPSRRKRAAVRAAKARLSRTLSGV